jgi:hypothetical protein
MTVTLEQLHTVMTTLTVTGQYADVLAAEAVEEQALMEAEADATPRATLRPGFLVGFRLRLAGSVAPTTLSRLQAIVQ